MGQAKLKQYLVNLNKIGKGKYSKVFFAIDTMNNKPVAIKEMISIDVAMFEAAVMLQFNHLNFSPDIYDFFILNHKAYLVMEYIEGTTLGSGNFKHISGEKGEKWSVKITIKILEGLDKLHTVGYVHGDLKPKNIMIKGTNPETIKLIDFNLAKKTQESEQKNYDLRSTASICVFLINGSLPNNINEVDISNNELKVVLRKALIPSSENNYPSAKDFISALFPFQ